MCNTMLRLKSGVNLIRKNGYTGLTLDGNIQFAKNVYHEIIIKALIEKDQSVESMEAIIINNNEIITEETSTSIELAAFILDFDNYLQT